MYKIIEIIKKIFSKKPLYLIEGRTQSNSLIEQKALNPKETFFKNIKNENSKNNIVSLQLKLEQGIINESDLSDEQLIKVKELYYNQIINLVNSIDNYKLKLNIN